MSPSAPFTIRDEPSPDSFATARGASDINKNKLKQTDENFFTG
jgi:hypothetical protein